MLLTRVIFTLVPLDTELSELEPHHLVRQIFATCDNWDWEPRALSLVYADIPSGQWQILGWVPVKV